MNTKSLISRFKLNKDKLCWKSKSTDKTFFPNFDNDYAKFIVVVFFPTPPF